MKYSLVGCIGGGQLGRMLALAGAPLDVRLAAFRASQTEAVLAAPDPSA